MYFERMIQINNLKFYHFSVPEGHRHISEYRKRQSEYLDDFLAVWGRCWYESIYALPKIYTNKDCVIRKACIYTGSLGKKNLAYLRVRGVFTGKIYREYKAIWKVISTVNFPNILLILLLPRNIVKIIAEYGSLRKWIIHIISLKKLEKFCGDYNKLYLYGAGVKGVRMSELLEEKAIQFESFVVSNLSEEVMTLKGHNVIELSQLENTPDTGIILSLNEKNKKQVSHLLDEKGFENIFELEIV